MADLRGDEICISSWVRGRGEAFSYARRYLWKISKPLARLSVVAGCDESGHPLACLCVDELDGHDGVAYVAFPDGFYLGDVEFGDVLLHLVVGLHPLGAPGPREEVGGRAREIGGIFVK